MANNPGARKAIRKIEARTEVNKARRSRVRTFLRRFEEAVTAGDVEAASRTISEIVAWRRANQPGGQNAGSVFTNPDGDSAGRLVDAAGCKGLRRGTAEVSPKHANFIQADAGGRADDVFAVMVAVRDAVEAASGVRLHPETRLVGFDEAEVTW